MTRHDHNFPMKDITWLIDGYNVIFGCGLYGKFVSPESLANGRDRLLQEIAQRLGADRGSVAVVFDAEKMPLTGQRERENENGIAVYYSINFANADFMIDEMIHQHPDPARLTVVSSDHWIQQSARRRRAEIVDSEAWFFESASMEGESPTSNASDQPATAGTFSRSPAGDVLSDEEKQQLTADAREIAREIEREDVANADPDDATPETKSDPELSSPPFPDELLRDLSDQIDDEP
ncbi:MAG: NYN domain-containing protein [Pirellulaceae bacterium]